MRLSHPCEEPEEEYSRTRNSECKGQSKKDPLSKGESVGDEELEVAQVWE